MISMFSPLIA